MTTDNLIVINGGAYTDVKKALRQWIDLYEEQLGPDYVFELYKHGRAKHVIQSDGRIDNEIFHYLVNYLRYPEEINYTVDVQGFTTINDVKIYPSIQLGKRIQLFILATDMEYDNVYGVTQDNEVIKVDFGGKVKTVNIERSYSEPDINLNELQSPELLKVLKKEAKKSTTKTEEEKLSKRFNIIAAIFLGLLLISYSTLSKLDTFIMFTFFIGLGVWCWFFSDYKMLRLNKLYLKSLVIALIIFAHGVLMINNIHLGSEIALVGMGMTLPLALLLVQRPSRLLFLHFTNREPVVEKPAPSFSDFIYIMLLLSSPVFSLLILKIF